MATQGWLVAVGRPAVQPPFLYAPSVTAGPPAGIEVVILPRERSGLGWRAVPASVAGHTGTPTSRPASTLAPPAPPAPPPAPPRASIAMSGGASIPPPPSTA